MKNLLITIALVLSACRAQPGGDVEAQAVGPNGLPKVYVLDGGLCNGTGTSADPLLCSVGIDNSTVFGTGSASAPLNALLDYDGGWFCDGSDGTVTFNGSSTVLGLVPSGNVYTMTRDICCHACIINSGVTVQGPRRFFDNAALTLNGKIVRNGSIGNPGNTGTAFGGAGAVGTGTGGLGAAGDGGFGTTGAGGNAINVSVNTDCVNTGGAAGVAGSTCKGGGGGSGSAGAGGTGGSLNNTTMASLNRYADRTLPGVLDGLVARTMASGTQYGGGSGGGGGGGQAGFSGGAGGGGGGYTVVAAKRFAGTGSIEAKGGAGGNGNAGGNTGGGGGGAGGLAVVVVAFGNFPTVTVTGGAGGTPGGTGTAGAAGGSGLQYLIRVGN